MMRILWFCASGYSFFWGTGIIICSVLLSFFLKKTAYKLMVAIAAIIGIFLIFLSAVPFPIWFYFVLGLLIICWLISHFRYSRFNLCYLIISIFLIAIFDLAVISELNEFVGLPLRLTRGDDLSTIYVIGDSMSAGTGEKGKVWPDILRETYGINIINLAQAGATASDAYRQAENIKDANSIVIIEIGGNDILEVTPLSQFETDLEKLVRKIRGESRAIIMFELPAIGLQGRYIAIQRKIAKKFNISLIPRRIFVSVLKGKDSTVDGIHLTEKGHLKMAQCVWPLIFRSIYIIHKN